MKEYLVQRKMVSLPYVLLSCSVLLSREKQCYWFLVYLSRDKLD